MGKCTENVTSTKHQATSKQQQVMCSQSLMNETAVRVTGRHYLMAE